MLRWTLALSCLVATASGFGVSLQQRRPLLPAQRRPYAPVSLVRMQADLAAAVPDEPAPPVGLKARVAAMLPPKKEMQKLVRRRHRPPNYPPRACVPRISPAAPLLSHRHRHRRQVPLASMFFCILFSYTILRDTKDVLVRAFARPAPALHRP